MFQQGAAMLGGAGYRTPRRCAVKHCIEGSEASYGPSTRYTKSANATHRPCLRYALVGFSETAALRFLPIAIRLGGLEDVARDRST